MKTITKMQQSILMRTAMMLLVLLASATTPVVALAGDLQTITVTKEGEGTAQMLYYFDQQQECNTGTEGTLSWLKATPARHWRFKEWKLVSGDGTISNPDMAKTAFRIGYQDATVKAVFEQIPIVFRTEPENLGTFMPDPGNNKHFQFVPEGGYQVLAMTWYSDDPDAESTEPMSISVLSKNGTYYEVPQNYGYVIATLSSLLDGNCGKVDTKQGLDGSQVTWAVSKSTGSDDYDVLTISGTGEMADYTSTDCAPWYYYRNQIKTVVIGENVTSIGNYAFRNFKNPEVQFTIPATVTSIGNYAFQNSTLTAIAFPHDRVSIGSYAFNGCYALTTATIGQGVGSYEEGEGIIGSNAFSECTALTTVTIGAGTTSIDKYAFEKCTNLTAVTINDHSRLVTIGKEAFYKCKKLSSITFGYGTILNTIDYKAFYGCKALTTVTIPDNVITIGNYAFTSCTALTTVNFAAGSQLQTIGARAFDNCTALTAVTIPDNVISIGNYAFSGCKALTTVDFAAGSQLQTIGSNAFDGNYKKNETPTLSSVGTLPASVNSIGVSAFKYYTGDHLYITVPAGKQLSVKSKKKDVTPSVSNNLADLLACHFTRLYKDRKGTQVLAIAMTDGIAHDINITLKKEEGGTITTVKENVEWAYSFDAQPITSAPVNETVALSWSGDDMPAGKYVSGFTFDVAGVTATPNEDCTEYTFNMPDMAVNVTGWLSDQEEFVLDLTDKNDDVVKITETQYILMNTLLGYFGAELDAVSGEYVNYIDLNLDGLPDLLLTRPIADEEDTENEVSDDPYAYEYTVRRLPGLEYVMKNYRFTPEYPFPYKYNRILVKLSDDYGVQQQPKLEDIDDDADNSGTIAQWAGDGQTHNVMLTRRTLYRDGKWNTLCLPFDVTISGSALDLPGVEAHKLTEANISGTKLNLTFGPAITTQLEAGVPYIIKWTAATENIVEPVFYDVTIPDMGITEADRQDEYYWEKLEARVAAFYASKGYDNGASKGAERVRFVGTYKSTTFNAEDKSILLLGGDNKLYYPKNGAGIGAQRAYFKLGDDNAQARQLTDFSIEFGDGETTTSLSPIPSPKGKGEVYDLQGRRVIRPTTKGLYIMNGKKYVIK